MACLLNKAVLSEGCQLNIIGVCPINYIRGLSNNIIGVCPINYIGGLSNKFLYRRMSNEFSKKKNLLFWNQLSYMENACVGEPMRTRDMGHGMWTFM